MSDLYVGVNGSGDGPLSALIQKIKRSQLAIEFDYYEIDRLLRHLKGASRYDKVVLGSDRLRPILEKIELALKPVVIDPRAHTRSKRERDIRNGKGCPGTFRGAWRSGAFLTYSYRSDTSLPLFLLSGELTNSPQYGTNAT